MAQKTYDSSLARMAGNIAAGLVTIPDRKLGPHASKEELAEWIQSVALLSVGLAGQIVRLCEESETKYGPANVPPAVPIQ